MDETRAGPNLEAKLPNPRGLQKEAWPLSERSQEGTRINTRWVPERTCDTPTSTSPTHVAVQVRVEQHQGTGERVDPI